MENNNNTVNQIPMNNTQQQQYTQNPNQQYQQQFQQQFQQQSYGMNNNYVPPIAYSSQGPSGYYGYAGQQPQQFNTVFTNVQKKYNNQPLDPATIAALQRNMSESIWDITEDEINRSMCTHRDANGDFTLSDDGDGYVRCSICGARFRPYTNGTIDDIKAFVDQFNNIFQTAKTIYDKASPVFIKKYSSIAPLVKRLPDFFDLAQRCMAEQDMNNNAFTPMQAPMFGYNSWSALNQIQGNPVYPQQMYYPQNQGYYPQQYPQTQTQMCVGNQNPMVSYNPTPMNQSAPVASNDQETGHQSFNLNK